MHIPFDVIWTIFYSVMRNSSDIIAMPQNSTLYINHSSCFNRHAYTNMNLHSSESDRRSHCMYLQQHKNVGYQATGAYNVIKSKCLRMLF